MYSCLSKIGKTTALAGLLKREGSVRRWILVGALLHLYLSQHFPVDALVSGFLPGANKKV